ncbi:ABC transporter permease [Paenibacillus sp. CC-CFT747]|nr:ABC transporter permease [Paenibacillus sp. CC-CFT747]
MEDGQPGRCRWQREQGPCLRRDSPGTALIEPVLLEGRWLQPGDRKAVVLDSFLLQDNPDLHAGSEVTLAVNGRKDTWTVIGITRKVSGDVVSYAPFEALSEAAGEAGKAMTVQTVTKDHSREGQAQTAAALQTRFKEKGYGSASTLITDDLRKVQENRFQTVLAFLAVMSVLLVIVAALGLTGTMSLSVLERTREFGIMRSIGASDRSMLGLIIGEGLVLGLVSWAVGSLLAYPVSRQLSAAVGHSLFEQPLDYRFPLSGVLLWLAGSLVVAAAASLLPAWKAARLEIRDVLAYE